MKIKAIQKHMLKMKETFGINIKWYAQYSPGFEDFFSGEYYGRHFEFFARDINNTDELEEVIFSINKEAKNGREYKK